MAIEISTLNPKEVRLHDAMASYLGDMGKIGKKSRQKIYRRLIMFHLFSVQEAEMFERIVERVNKPQE